ncbi:MULTISPECIES: hypothetical protein [unclassified Spirosoma]|uniref:hypothetical protein n=1 Tax=unclassified Spirosoma TaxID=2621999 RepID=UPI000961EF8F|nr:MULTISPECIES: hypothetical protein [unclassified Spirosoma]MBN8822510.1 hypothetical protein [Spirosoma sp.]OJW74015.1 MAG: hypothetical protein BGO59_12815 [Spirosoma sp. 48-14]
MNEIEPKIRPLVDALNRTGIVRTFSSCEGHFAPDQQTIVDRNHAYVRFVPAEDRSIAEVENLLAYVLTGFKQQHGLIPIKLMAYKLYTPVDDEQVEETFVLELHPFNRFDPPDRKRMDVDRAIEQVGKLIDDRSSTGG